MSKTISKVQQNWIGQVINDRYKIESLLGHGGMSTVYRANDPNLRRTVAVKLIHPHLSSDPQFVRRFEQEAASVAQLRHPNIIQVYDFDHDDEGLYYMVLEYLPGDTLQARLATLNQTQQRLPLEETVQITTAICDAVAYAHQRGMIHRDLKPANVMLNPQGRPVLMDFGVAKILGGTESNTATGTVVGTALYMSPEQARGEHPDARSDIYSIGVMLYEMITGKPPFQADSAVSVMLKHVTQPLPDIRQLNQNVPDLLIAVTKKALAKEAAQRYQTASDMALAIQALPLPGQASASSAGYYTAVGVAPYPSQVHSAVQSVKPDSGVASAVAAPKPASQVNPLIWVVGITALVLLIGIGGGLTWLFSRSGGKTPTPDATLAALSDSALPSAEKMVKIPAGTYPIGREASGANYASPQQVKLDEFWLDQYEVSSIQYAHFLTETKTTPPLGWPQAELSVEQAILPVKGVTWEQAAAFCLWAKKRLPTEAEWEVAARGPEGRLFPWGDDPRAVELPRSGTYKVGGKPTNQSALGVFDMAGNVWEWVGEPYTPLKNETDRILRGGENGLVRDMAYRLIGSPDQESFVQAAGLRCAADQVKPVTTQVATAEGVLEQEDFANSGSGWPILSEGSYFFGYHPPDYYHIEVGQADGHTIVTRPPDFDNISVETEVLVDHTNTETGAYRYGLTLRRSGDNFYAFVVSSRPGTWQILKSSASGLQVLKEGQIETLRGFAPKGFIPDKTDNLRVDAAGPDFTFYINSQVVGQVNDSDYASGEAGFYVETMDETLTHVHFDSLTVRAIEGGQAVIPTSPPPSTALLEDSFTDDKSGWPILKDDKYIIGYHPPDYYHLQVGQPNDHTIVSYPREFKDATVETDVLVDHTDTDQGNFRYGLALRRSGDNYYAFVVSSRTGNWHILKSSANGLQELETGQVDTLRGFAPVGFTPDKTDRLRVDAQGGDFIFHINDKVVAQVSDASYTGGEVGFYVETFDETLAHVHYETITVRDVEFTAAAPSEATLVAKTTAVPTPKAPTAEPVTPTSEAAQAVETAATPETETATATFKATTSTSSFDDLPTRPAPTPSPTALPTASPTSLPTPSPTDTPLPTAPPPPSLPAGMTLVPAGYFQMGSSTGPANEQPEHPVFVDGFYLDQFEVSNAQYRRCAAGGGCTASNAVNSFTYQNYRDDPAYDNYPVIAVSWDQAQAYCGWVGKRLPTEAEWEYAASGPQNLTWPWGNTFATNLAAADAPDVQPVDSYPEGVNPFGLYNMAGNVGEWVADVFDTQFYATTPAVNPISQGSGPERIFRGGSFGNPDGAYYTTSRRYPKPRDFNDVDVGFRCAQDAPGVTPPDQRQSQLEAFCQVYTAYNPNGACP